MKKVLFLAALAATVGFTACNKDNGPEVNGSGDAVLMVKLPDNIVTRSVEASQGATTATVITDLVIFMTNEGGTVLRVEELTGADLTAKYKRFEQVNPAIAKVLVVANIPTAGEKTTLKGLGTSALVKSFGFTAASQNATAGIEGQVLMGEATAVVTTPDPLDDGHIYKEAQVTLNALTARMEIGAVKAGTGIASVELVGVWVNNFYLTNGAADATKYLSDNACWDVTPLTSGSPAATDIFTGFTIPTYTPSVYHNPANNTEVKVEAGSKVYAYQVFAGNLPHVILLVKGVYDENFYEDGKKYFCGFVTFTSYKEGATTVDAFAANTIYKIGTGATGIEITPENVTPEPELNAYDLFVNCIIAPWTEKNVTPGV